MNIRMINERLNEEVITNLIGRENDNILYVGKNFGESRDIISINLKCPYIKVSNNIKLLLEKTRHGLDMNVMFENICKGIEIEDEIMDKAIRDMSLVYSNIITWLNQSKLVRNINYDTMMVEDEFGYDNYSYHDMIMDLRKIYTFESSNSSSRNISSSYVNELFAFGSRGAKVARLLEEAGISRYRKSRSGYLIEFIADGNRIINDFTLDFAKDLATIGVPCMAIPLVALDYFWVDDKE